MAIKIPANKIFEISSDVIIDNDYDKVEIPVNKSVYRNEIEHTHTSTVFSEVGESSENRKMAFTSAGIKDYEIIEEGGGEAYYAYIVETIKISIPHPYSNQNLQTFLTKSETAFSPAISFPSPSTSKWKLKRKEVSSKAEFMEDLIEDTTVDSENLAGASVFELVALSNVKSRIGIDISLQREDELVIYFATSIGFSNKPLINSEMEISSLFGFLLNSYTLEFQYETIRLESETATYGDGTNITKLKGNELIRDSAYIDSELIANVLASNVLDTYENGLEVATVECLIGSYSTYYGVEKISLAGENNLPMAFRVGDVVIPYSVEMQKVGVDINGNDMFAPFEIPYSKYPDGTPKQFFITQCEIIADGLVRQKLTMREVLQKEIETNNWIELVFDTNEDIEIGLAGRNGGTSTYGLEYNWDVYINDEFFDNFLGGTSATQTISIPNNKAGFHKITMISKLVNQDYCARSVCFYGSASIGSYDKLISVKGYGNAFNGTNAIPRYCYYRMFVKCTALVTAPELPAIVLAESCYAQMFSGCTSLTTAPALPATTLNAYCYDYMFNGCTNLVTAPELPATSLANYCYSYMFQGCTKLVNAPELPATVLKIHCYDSMFQGCSSLEVAPELPATTLTAYCYDSMFWGCSNLIEVKCYANNITTSHATYWLANIITAGTLYLPSGATMGTGILPTNWTRADL